MNNHHPASWYCTLLATFLGLALAQATEAQTTPPRLQVIEKLPGSVATRPTAVSWNGSYVVGFQQVLTAGTIRSIPFRWPPQTAQASVALPLPPGCTEAEVYAVDDSGNIVVGGCTTMSGVRHGYKWSFGVAEDLGPSPSGYDWGLTALSKDGFTAYGYLIADEHGQTSHLVRWSIIGGCEDLGAGTSDLQENCFAASGDGQVAVGSSLLPSEETVPMRRAGVGISHLPNLPRTPNQQGPDFGQCLATNFDGTDIVGMSNGEGFRWTLANGMIPMPLNPNIAGGWAVSMSADGYCAGGVGFVAVNGFSRAVPCIWQGDRPPVNVDEFLPAHGIALTPFSTLYQVFAVSGDGYYIVGAGTIGNELNRGWIVDLKFDSDGDGLLDDWELAGIPYIDSDGHPRRYPLPDANPLRKDIYVEIDAHSGEAPSQAAIDRVTAAFASAPVPAVPGLVGGLPGVALHAMIDDTDILAHNYVEFPGWLEYDADKVEYFGTVAERADQTGWAVLRPVKAMAYRYCIFATTLPGLHGESQTLGRAELEDGAPALGPRVGTNDFMIGLHGYIPPPNTSVEDLQAAAFMHELGHTLGLYHGGGDAAQNYNPNHHSVMNYMWAGTRRFGENAFGPSVYLNYSNYGLSPLVEDALDESAGIVGNMPIAVPIVVRSPGTAGLCGQSPSSQGICDASNESLVNTCIRYVPSIGPVDWNNDGVISPAGRLVCADPNGLKEATPGETLVGVNEWTLLAYNFRDSVYYDDLSYPIDDVAPCPTIADEMFLESLPPAPPSGCPAAIVPGAPQSSSSTLCASRDMELAIAPGSQGPFLVQWQRRDDLQSPSMWIDLADTMLAGGTNISGTRERVLRIANVHAADLGGTAVRVRYQLTDLCGGVAVSFERTLHTACAADVDCSGAVEVSDIFAFLAAWFAGDPVGDFNHSGLANVQDIFEFLSAWFAGC